MKSSLKTLMFAAAAGAFLTAGTASAERSATLGNTTMASFGSAEALTAFPGLAMDRTFSESSDQHLVNGEHRPPALIQLAKETSSTKTTVKTKNDGTVVTTEKTRTNDGEGNKTKTTTTTTTPPSSGSGGASYEGP